ATMWDGGVLTGDKCYSDADGNFFYVGRVDDMLRVGGVWVSPAEVESVLAEHEGVLECAVIGVADENELIKPKAFVVARLGQAVDASFEESVRTLLRARLAHIKCPRWIEFVPELPKTATGKIQRFRLRAAEARRHHP
ncbi:MAG: AMP-binding enzyme, partial [Burkholderiaceae bacterium]